MVETEQQILEAQQAVVQMGQCEIPIRDDFNLSCINEEKKLGSYSRTSVVPYRYLLWYSLLS